MYNLSNDLFVGSSVVKYNRIYRELGFIGKLNYVIQLSNP